MMDWPRLVVTAFGPYGGASVNASEQLVALLQRRFPEALAPWRERLFFEVLPCPEGAEAPRQAQEQARDLLHRHGRALYVLTGQAPGRAGLSLEYLAANLYQGRPIEAMGPAAYSADLPDWRRLPPALRRAGVPASLSRDGGDGPCNLLFYTLRHQAARLGLPIRVGFLHVPVTPAQAAGEGGAVPSWPLSLSRAGLVLILRHLARYLTRAGEEGGAPWNGAHLVDVATWTLPVREVARSLRFYTRVLGMRAQAFDGGATLQWGGQSLRLAPVPAGEAQPLRLDPPHARICFLTDQPLPKFVAHLVNEGVAVEEGPVSRSETVGEVMAVYFRDPDGHLLAVAQRPGGDGGA